jgi:hypothetical protein
MSNFKQDLIIFAVIATASLGWIFAVSMGWA